MPHFHLSKHSLRSTLPLILTGLLMAVGVLSIPLTYYINQTNLDDRSQALYGTDDVNPVCENNPCAPGFTPNADCTRCELTDPGSANTNQANASVELEQQLLDQAIADCAQTLNYSTCVQEYSDQQQVIDTQKQQVSQKANQEAQVVVNEYQSLLDELDEIDALIRGGLDPAIRDELQARRNQINTRLTQITGRCSERDYVCQLALEEIYQLPPPAQPINLPPVIVNTNACADFNGVCSYSSPCPSGTEAIGSCNNSGQCCRALPPTTNTGCRYANTFKCVVTEYQSTFEYNRFYCPTATAAWRDAGGCTPAEIKQLEDEYYARIVDSEALYGLDQNTCQNTYTGGCFVPLNNDNTGCYSYGHYIENNISGDNYYCCGGYLAKQCTNSVNDSGFAVTSQTDPSYANLQLPGECTDPSKLNTYEEAACGPMSAYMIVNNFGADDDDLSPVEFVKENYDRNDLCLGTPLTEHQTVLKKYGFATELINNNVRTQDMVASLDHGWTLMVHGTFEGVDHIALVTGTNDQGELIYADPYFDSQHYSSKPEITEYLVIKTPNL